MAEEGVRERCWHRFQACCRISVLRCHGAELLWLCSLPASAFPSRLLWPLTKLPLSQLPAGLPVAPAARWAPTVLICQPAQAGLDLGTRGIRSPDSSLSPQLGPALRSAVVPLAPCTFPPLAAVLWGPCAEVFHCEPAAFCSEPSNPSAESRRSSALLPPVSTSCALQLPVQVRNPTSCLLPLQPSANSKCSSSRTIWCHSLLPGPALPLCSRRTCS